MDLPPPPDDLELRNVIDKLAQFVARNGPDFERMTKEKQRDNAKFAFLFGGSYHDYYVYRLTTEQLIIKQQASQQAAWIQPELSFSGAPPPAPYGPPQPGFSGPPPGFGGPPPPFPLQGPPPMGPPPGEYIHQQIVQLQEQMASSEQNLAAQRATFAQKTQEETQLFLNQFPMEQFLKLLAATGIVQEDLTRVIQPLVTSCTKENISLAKNWILAHLNTDDHYNLLAFYIHQRVLDELNTFEHRLHLVYLINDLLHHCQRKQLTTFHAALTRVAPAIVVKMYEGIVPDQLPKVDKLLGLWEKNGYFKTDQVNTMRQPDKCWRYFEDKLSELCTDQLRQIRDTNDAEYLKMENQNKEFVDHCNGQITSLQMQLAPPPFAGAPPGAFPPQMGQGSFALPPPDLSRPPPLREERVQESPRDVVKRTGIIPSVPYHDLPAGLIVPMVTLGDRDYAPINPVEIRLPPPLPPTERLLTAIEAFYQPPSSERPRDTEGWERLGLYEFYLAKENVRKGVRVNETNPFAGYGGNYSYAEKREDRRAQAGYSRFASTRRSVSRGRSRSRSHSRSSSSGSSVASFRSGGRSRTRSPRRRSRTRSRTRSPVRRSRSASPVGRGGFGAPAARSPSPPRGRPSRFDSGNRREDREDSRDDRDRPRDNPLPLESSGNKGADLLKKMGWGGGGLGKGESGRMDPVESGEARGGDNKTGIGANIPENDYDEYRKRRSQQYTSGFGR